MSETRLTDPCDPAGSRPVASQSVPVGDGCAPATLRGETISPEREGSRARSAAPCQPVEPVATKSALPPSSSVTTREVLLSSKGISAEVDKPVSNTRLHDTQENPWSGAFETSAPVDTRSLVGYEQVDIPPSQPQQETPLPSSRVDNPANPMPARPVHRVVTSIRVPKSEIPVTRITGRNEPPTRMWLDNVVAALSTPPNEDELLTELRNRMACLDDAARRRVLARMGDGAPPRVSSSRGDGSSAPIFAVTDNRNFAAEKVRRLQKLVFDRYTDAFGRDLRRNPPYLPYESYLTLSPVRPILRRFAHLARARGMSFANEVMLRRTEHGTFRAMIPTECPVDTYSVTQPGDVPFIRFISCLITEYENGVLVDDYQDVDVRLLPPDAGFFPAPWMDGRWPIEWQTEQRRTFPHSRSPDAAPGSRDRHVIMTFKDVEFHQMSSGDRHKFYAPIPQWMMMTPAEITMPMPFVYRYATSHLMSPSPLATVLDKMARTEWVCRYVTTWLEVMLRSRRMHEMPAVVVDGIRMLGLEAPLRPSGYEAPEFPPFIREPISVVRLTQLVKDHNGWDWCATRHIYLPHTLGVTTKWVPLYLETVDIHVGSDLLGMSLDVEVPVALMREAGLTKVAEHFEAGHYDRASLRHLIHRTKCLMTAPDVGHSLAAQEQLQEAQQSLATAQTTIRVLKGNEHSAREAKRAALVAKAIAEAEIIALKRQLGNHSRELDMAREELTTFRSKVVMSMDVLAKVRSLLRHGSRVNEDLRSLLEAQLPAAMRKGTVRSPSSDPEMHPSPATSTPAREATNLPLSSGERDPSLPTLLADSTQRPLLPDNSGETDLNIPDPRAASEKVINVAESERDSSDSPVISRTRKRSRSGVESSPPGRSRKRGGTVGGTASRGGTPRTRNSRRTPRGATRSGRS